MLPDKNELNNETIEKISGGGSYPRSLDPLQGVNPIQEQARPKPSAGTTESSYVPLYSGQHPVTEQHTDSQSSNCETQIIQKIAPVGDSKTTVPAISDKLVKIH